MKIRSQRDFVAGLFLLIVGSAFALGATQYSFGVASKPGPGYFPFGLGVLLAGLGALIAFGALARGGEDGDPVGAIPWRPLLCIVGALVLFGFALPRFGFLLSFPVMIIVTSMGGDEFRWKDAILNAAILTAFSWLVFIFVLAPTEF